MHIEIFIAVKQVCPFFGSYFFDAQDLLHLLKGLLDKRRVLVMLHVFKLISCQPAAFQNRPFGTGVIASVFQNETNALDRMQPFSRDLLIKLIGLFQIVCLKILSVIGKLHAFGHIEADLRFRLFFSRFTDLLTMIFFSESIDLV